MTFRSLAFVAAALVAPLSLTVPALAEGGVFVGVEGEAIAVSGYDTVSYFRGDGAPVMGDARFSVTWKGAEWRFANQANADAFKADPTAFAPQYGGHCAWAMGRGYLAPGDAKVYKVVDGKLYLNFNSDVQKMWNKDISGFIAKGDPNWKALPEGKVFGGD